MRADRLVRGGRVSAAPRNPAATAIEANTTRTPSTESTPRQPIKSPIRPDAEAPSRLPVIAPASVRLIATWRFSGPTRSLVRLSETGNTPPEPMPARMRLANSSGNDVAIAPRILANPSSTRQTIISRALPNMSAMAPSTGWMMAKVKAKTAAKLAAVAMLTEKSSATCGSTGSSARADRAAEKVASAMILSAGGMRLDAVTALPASCARAALGERVVLHQGFQQGFELAQRHHVGSVRRRAIGNGT